VFKVLGSKKQRASRVEEAVVATGVCVDITGSREGVTSLEDTISMFVVSWTQLAATITLLRAVLLATRIVAISSFVFE
jgi:hypothetical protein